MLSIIYDQSLLLLLLLLLNYLLPVIGNNYIAFSGFTEGTIYTYYTNGANPIAELTCIATPTDNTVSAISSSWYYKTASTGSSVLRFEDVATVVKWRESRIYFCRAVYNINGQKQQEDSGNIAVAIECKSFLNCICFVLILKIENMY